MLFIDSATFVSKILISGPDSVKKKLTFRFFIKDTDSLTMNGWLNDSSKTDYGGPSTPPEIELHNGVGTSVHFGKATYLGNLVLYKHQLKVILRHLNKYKHKYVIFVPAIDVTSMGQVVYNIGSSNDDPRSDPFSVKVNVTMSAVTTNPSPPKNSN